MPRAIFLLGPLVIGTVIRKYQQHIVSATSVVAVAQLVESWIVIPVVVGSSPIGHPKLLDVVAVVSTDLFSTVPDFVPVISEFLSTRLHSLATTAISLPSRNILRS